VDKFSQYSLSLIWQAFYERIRIPLSEIKTISKSIDIFLSSQINTIDTSILWSCLDDDLDDKVLIDLYGRDTVCSSDTRAIQILRLRKNILQHLRQNIIQLTNGNSHVLYLEKKGSISLVGVSRVFRMAILLTPCLKEIRQRGEVYSSQKSSCHADLSCSTIGTFLSAHYKLLLAVFSFATKGVALRYNFMRNIMLTVTGKLPQEPQERESSCSLFASIIQRCAESLSSTYLTQTTKPLTREHISCPLSPLSMSAEILSKNFLRQLKHCEDATISCHIIDLISVLFLHTECPQGEDITFADILRSVYNLSIDASEVNLPYTFFKVNDLLTTAIGKGESETEWPSLVNEAFSLFIRSSNSLLKTKDSLTGAFVHHLLAHWSALILKGTSQFQFLTEMVGALFTSIQRSKQCISPSSGKKNTYPGLNEKTHNPLFELLLHMVNTSFSLSKPHSIKKKGYPEVFQTDGPYGEVLWPLELYSKLLSMFQFNHMHFPRRLSYTIFKNSLLMAKLSDYQIRKCVQWRNSQQVCNSTKSDSASAEYLQPVVDSIASHCIRGIFTLCNTMKFQENTDKNNWGRSYKNAKSIAGLLRCSERVKETLQYICQSQNLVYPKDFSSSLNPHASLKRKRDNDEGNFSKRKVRQTNKRLSPQRNFRLRSSSDKVLTPPSVLELLPESSHINDLHYESVNGDACIQSDSDESQLNENKTNDDYSSIGSDEDDSFGVIGDWAT